MNQKPPRKLKSVEARELTSHILHSDLFDDAVTGNCVPHAVQMSRSSEVLSFAIMVIKTPLLVQQDSSVHKRGQKEQVGKR